MAGVQASSGFVIRVIKQPLTRPWHGAGCGWVGGGGWGGEESFHPVRLCSADRWPPPIYRRINFTLRPPRLIQAGSIKGPSQHGPQSARPTVSTAQTGRYIIAELRQTSVKGSRKGWSIGPKPAPYRCRCTRMNDITCVAKNKFNFSMKWSLESTGDQMVNYRIHFAWKMGDLLWHSCRPAPPIFSMC